MADVRGLRAPTIKSRLTNCRRVEKFEGDLDSLFELDRLADLLERLTYSAEDERNGRRSRHRVPINGDLRTGTATLKRAVGLYLDFRHSKRAFVFTGKPFRKVGPKGYQLGHLVDHKEHGNRWREELVGADYADQPPTLFGLFTSASNAAYFPTAFLRPTDFSFPLRSLVQRQARRLYGGVCRMLPPPLDVRPSDDPDWDPSRFAWGEPVGETTNLQDFLEFRCCSSNVVRGGAKAALSQTAWHEPGALAKALDVPRTRIERVARGQTSMSSDTACRLAKAFGTTPSYWMNMQTNYDLALAGRSVDVSHIRRIEGLNPAAGR